MNWSVLMMTMMMRTIKMRMTTATAKVTKTTMNNALQCIGGDGYKIWLSPCIKIEEEELAEAKRIKMKITKL